MGRISRSVRRSLFEARKKVWQRTTSRNVKPAVILVGGVQRSGTTMLMTFLGHLLETRVYYERDERVFDGYFTREPSEIQRQLGSEAGHYHVFRVQFDAHRLRFYLDEFMPAKLLFVFRRYRGVVDSYQRTWPGGRNHVDDVATNRSFDGWQASGMTDTTFRAVNELYRSDLSDASVLALFWWFRNQLFFDLRLHEDRRVLLVNYEDFVSDAAANGRALTDFVGARFRTAAAKSVYSTSALRNPNPDIDEEIEARCDEMYQRLVTSWTAQQTAAVS